MSIHTIAQGLQLKRVHLLNPSHLPCVIKPNYAVYLKCKATNGIYGGDKQHITTSHSATAVPCLNNSYSILWPQTASALFSLDYFVCPPSKTRAFSLICPTHCSLDTCELQICDVSLSTLKKYVVLRKYLASWICRSNTILTCSSSTLLSSWSISLSESSPDASWLLYKAPPFDTLYTLLIFTVRDANICR